MAIQLTPALEQKLQLLAAETSRTAEDLACEALESYLTDIETLKAEVLEAEEEADREGWLSTEEVFERLNQRLLKTA